MQSEKFSVKDLERACDDLSMVPFFPQNARPSVMMLLSSMCPHREALKWLVSEVVNHVSKWPGPAELRGILCTRYDPADKIDTWCSLPGYTAAEAEAKHYDRHKQLTEANGYSSEESADVIRQIAKKVRQIS